MADLIAIAAGNVRQVLLVALATLAALTALLAFAALLALLARVRCIRLAVAELTVIFSLAALAFALTLAFALAALVPAVALERAAVLAPPVIVTITVTGRLVRTHGRSQCCELLDHLGPFDEPLDDGLPVFDVAGRGRLHPLDDLGKRSW